MHCFLRSLIGSGDIIGGLGLGDLVLSATIISGLTAILKWIGPRLDKLLNIIPEMHAITEKNANSLEVMARGLDAQAQSWAILARVVASLNSAVSLQARKIVLLIEDSAIDTRRLAQTIAPVASRHRLTLISVSTLEEAWHYLPTSRLVVLDVQLPDCNPDKARSITSVTPCPVIISSHDQYSESDFPGCYAVVDKSCIDSSFSDLIEKAINSH